MFQMRLLRKHAALPRVRSLTFAGDCFLRDTVENTCAFHVVSIRNRTLSVADQISLATSAVRIKYEQTAFVNFEMMYGYC